MSSYIPPHRRNKGAVAPVPPKEEDTSLQPSNFPQLAPVNSTNKSVPWTASKLKFEEKPKQIPMFTSSQPVEPTIVCPRPFYNRYRSSALDYEEDVEDDEMGPTGPADDGWTTVTRKVRRKKTLIEKYEEELKEEEERKEDEEKKDTVWNEVNEYETYWDERRY